MMRYPEVGDLVRVRRYAYIDEVRRDDDELMCFGIDCEDIDNTADLGVLRVVDADGKGNGDGGAYYGYKLETLDGEDVSYWWASYMIDLVEKDDGWTPDKAEIGDIFSMLLN